MDRKIGLKYLKIALLLLFCYAPLFSYCETKSDSLWSVWKNKKLDENDRFEALNDYSWEFLYNNSDSMRVYGKLLSQSAADSKNIYWQAKACNTIAVSYYLQSEYKEALDFFDLSMQHYTSINDREGIAAAASNVGNVFSDVGEYPKALTYYLKALKIEEELELKDDAAGSYGNIAILHYEMGNYEEALKFHDKSILAFTELNNAFNLARSYNNKGTVYERMNDLENAVKSYERCLAIRDSIGDENNKSSTFHNLAVVNKRLGNDSLAEVLFLKSLAIEEKKGDQFGMANSNNSIGQFFNDKKQYKTALDWCEKGLSLAREIESISMERSACECLYISHKGLNNTGEALRFHEVYLQLRDSVNNEDKDRDMMMQGFQFKYEMKTIQDSIVHQEEQIRKDLEQSLVLEQEAVKRKGLYIGIGVISLFLLFVLNRFRASQRQKKIIQKQKEQVDNAFAELEEKNTEIMDSIAYAKRIQSAILPPLKIVKEYLQDSFILYKPKDVVAGDFYWMEQKDGKILFAAADCTGHGVPGAMVSVICNNGLNRSVREHGLTDPGEILDKTREIVIQEFEKSEEDVKDGMDIALCSLEGHKLEYAGAHNPLWIVRDGEVLETKANKQPIGKFYHLSPYTTHTFELKKNDILYIFSDGYVDQFGGEKGKKFKAKAFRKLLISINKEEMQKQRTLIDNAFEDWKGDLEQIDDVCIIGVRI